MFEVDAPLDWPTWLASINLFQVACVVIALYVVVKLLVKFWPWLGKLMAFTDAQTKLPDFIVRTDKALAEQAAKIAEIHHEVHYNNGSSVKDGITRAENAVERIELGVRGLYDRMDAADAADRQLRNDFESTQPRKAIEMKEHRNGNENDDQH